MKELILVIDEFEGQDLKYLLKNFGVKYNFQKIKAYVGKIQIKQDYNKFITDFKIDNLYERCTGITLIPEFKEIDFDGKQYVMDKFSKNKKYTEYPIEIVYRRRLEDL